MVEPLKIVLTRCEFEKLKHSNSQHALKKEKSFITFIHTNLIKPCEIFNFLRKIIIQITLALLYSHPPFVIDLKLETSHSALFKGEKPAFFRTYEFHYLPIIYLNDFSHSKMR